MGTTLLVVPRIPPLACAPGMTTLALSGLSALLSAVWVAELAGLDVRLLDGDSTARVPTAKPRWKGQSKV